ncbi:uncharacterized protein V6R79_012986 [Siganus canaliculatus]
MNKAECGKKEMKSDSVFSFCDSSCRMADPAVGLSQRLQNQNKLNCHRKKKKGVGERRRNVEDCKEVRAGWKNENDKVEEVSETRRCCCQCQRQRREEEEREEDDARKTMRGRRCEEDDALDRQQQDGRGIQTSARQFFHSADLRLRTSTHLESRP